jgi:hypothetical protein
MGFSEGPLAGRATEAAEAITVLTEALTGDGAIHATHCFGLFCFGNHNL